MVSPTEGQIDSALDEWFETKILCYEEDLTRLLRRLWNHSIDIVDLRQDVYIRVYESASTIIPGQERAFLMATAKHLVLDRLRRERIVSIDYVQDFDASYVLVDEVSTERRVSAR